MFAELRRQTLEAFRGYREPRPQIAARKAADVVPLILKKIGLQERLDEEEVLAAWMEVVGAFLAEHSTPVGLKRGVLQVQVLQPTVHYELDRVWKKKILTEFQTRFGKKMVREIRFRLS